MQQVVCHHTLWFEVGFVVERGSESWKIQLPSLLFTCAGNSLNTVWLLSPMDKRKLMGCSLFILQE